MKKSISTRGTRKPIPINKKEDEDNDMRVIRIIIQFSSIP
jgi:hypothetical protein